MRYDPKFVIFSVLALVMFGGGSFAQQGILDFDRFKTEIEPLLTQTMYTSPGPTPMSCIDCHGDSTNVASSTFTLTAGQSRLNFIETAQEIVLSDADESDLLLKPLSLAAGGKTHGGVVVSNDGGEQFTTTNDAAYQTLINWILDATRSSVGARVSDSEAHPNPFRFHTDLVYFLSTAAEEVEVVFFSQEGRELKRFRGDTLVGANRVRWNGRDKDNEPLPTGIYFYVVKARFEDGTFTHSGKVVYTP